MRLDYEWTSPKGTYEYLTAITGDKKTVLAELDHMEPSGFIWVTYMHSLLEGISTDTCRGQTRYAPGTPLKAVRKATEEAVRAELQKVRDKADLLLDAMRGSVG